MNGGTSTKTSGGGVLKLGTLGLFLRVSQPGRDVEILDVWNLRPHVLSGSHMEVPEHEGCASLQKIAWT